MKIIKKLIHNKDLRYKIFCYFLIKLGYSNIKLQAMEIRNKKIIKIRKKYIKRLDDINNKIENDIKCNSKNKRDNQNRVWICWLQGEENAPEIVKQCINSIKKYNQDVICITNDNINEYINLPDYIFKKWHNGEISNTHFSDLIRLNLLNQYGGTWIDSTCLQTEKIPDYIKNSNLFLYKFKNIEDITIKANNWFIHTKANNKILKMTEELLIEFWKEKNRLFDYFIFHLFLTISLEYYKDEWKNMIEITDDAAHLLQYNLHKKYKKENFEILINNHFIHKLTYKLKDEIINDKNNIYNYILKHGANNE